ncbi:MAG: hypothetical protein KTR25_15560 [Myxococcales bacterium]|nr:hypothetical protein [Myxococcales bacterium]
MERPDHEKPGSIATHWAKSTGCKDNGWRWRRQQPPRAVDDSCSFTDGVVDTPLAAG